MAERFNDRTSGFEASRRRLISIAYRMLGSRAEAEDIVQETWLRWQGADVGTLREPVAWLTTVTTRLAIDRLRELDRERDSHRAVLAEAHLADAFAPSAESLVSDASELSFGLSLMLERLAPEERAALLLYEAFDCSYAEIARVLSRTTAACRQIVHRAKVRMRRAAVAHPADADRAFARNNPPVRPPVQSPEPASSTEAPVMPTRGDVDQIRDAVASQDKAAVIRLMLEEVSVVGDVFNCVASFGSRARRESLADHWISWVEAGGTVEAITLEGRRGLAFLAGCEIVMAIGFELRAGRLARCWIISEAAVLDVLNNAFNPLRALADFCARQHRFENWV